MLREMRGLNISKKRLIAFLLAVNLCVLLTPPTHALASNTRIASPVSVANETAYTGVFEAAPQPCTGLFCQANPVNNTDPIGHETVAELNVTTAIQFNSRSLEGVGVAAFKAGAMRGISAIILKNGAVAIIGGVGATSIGGPILALALATHDQAEIKEAIDVQVEDAKKTTGSCCSIIILKIPWSLLWGDFIRVPMLLLSADWIHGMRCLVSELNHPNLSTKFSFIPTT